jgi:hypothetical protein
VVISKKDDVQTITGNDFKSYTVVAVAPHPQSGIENGIRYSLDCELHTTKTINGTCAVQVQFSGSETGGHQISWSSPWQTGITKVDELWRPFHFSEAVPEDIIKLSNLEVRVNVIPYDEPALAWNPKRAKDQNMECRHLTLIFSPPFDIPNEPEHNWLLF